MGRAWVLEYGKYGSWDGPGVVPGIAPPRYPPSPIPRVHHPTRPGWTTGWTTVYTRLNMVVGLISVTQLTLGTHFSDITGITEGYNLVGINRINNHFLIPGTK